MPSNKDFEEISGINSCCARLCADKFDDEDLRSKSAVLAAKDISKIDLEANLRGRWNKRIEFLLSIIGFAVGLGNVWRFPIKVYENGGGAFLIPYFLMCIMIGVPLLLLEMGVGQFTGMGCTKAFKMVPVLYGIGWGQVIMASLILVYYGVVISWAYFYLFASFNRILPWSTCNNSFNSINCFPSSSPPNNFTNVSLVVSTEEYYNRYVLGFQKLNGEFYSMNESPGPPQWHLSLCLLLVWMVAFLVLMLGVKVSGKVIYFAALFPYAAITFLFILGCTLPGAKMGLLYYLKPNLTKLKEPKVYLIAVEQLFFSTSTAIGGMVTLASYNNFHDNFYRDAVIVIMADCFTSFFAGFAVFPILGYMSHRTGKKVEEVIRGGAGLFFVTYPEALSTLAAPNVWTILFMLMTISLGMDSQFAMLETVITALGDAFGVLRKTVKHRILSVFVISSCFFFAGLLLVTPGGTYYFDVLDRRVSLYGLPTIAILECISVGIVYGHKKFRLDIRMMTGFSLNNYFFIMMAYICPGIIFVIVISSIIFYEPITVNGKSIPAWGECIAYLFLCLVIGPVIYGMIYIAIRYKKRYSSYTRKQYLKTLITPPIYYGPKYKANWLLSIDYENKFLENYDNPKFLSHIPKVENPKLIYQAAKGTLNQPQ